MVHGAVRHFFRVLSGLILLVLLAIAFGAVWLSRGPVSLDSLTPYLEDALTDQATGFQVKLGTVALVWEHGNQALDLRIMDARAIDTDGLVLARVPEVGITLNPLGLLTGDVRLRSVELIGPHLKIVREGSGALRFGMWYPVAAGNAPSPDLPPQPDGGSEDVARAIVAALVAGPDAPGPFRDLTAVRVVRASLLMTDERLHVDWRVPEVTMELFRKSGGGLGVLADLRVDQGDDEARLELTGDYSAAAGTVDLTAIIQGLRPAALADIEEALAPMAALDLPLDGTAELSLMVTDTLEPVSLNISVAGRAGHLRLPALLSRAMPVQDMELIASFTGRAEEILLDRFHIKLDNASEVLAATEIGASGTLIRQPGSDYAGGLTLTIDSLATAGLQEWWPVGMADGARDWVVENLSDGHVTHGEWQVPLAGATLADVTATDIAGIAHAEGITVDFLRPMKPVREAVADLTFHSDRIDFDLRSGKVFDLRLTGGSISIFGLDIADEHAEITLEVEGPLDDALVLLDQQPLGYPARLGLKPSQADGFAKVKLRLAFPLLADLKLEALEVQAIGDLSGVTLRQAVFGRDLTDGTLRLDVTAEALKATGQAFLDGIPASFVWDEIFSGKPFASRYVVKAVVEEDKRDVFGLVAPPFVAPYAVGPSDVDMDVVIYRGGETEIEVQADLTDTALALNLVGWQKPAGKAAQASVSVRVLDGYVADVPAFEVRTASDEVISGTARFHVEGEFAGLTLDRVAVEGLRGKGTVRVRADGVWEVRVDGDLVDVRSMLGQGDNTASPAARTPPESEASSGDDLPPMDILASFPAVQTAQDGVVSNVRIRGLRDAERWTTVHADATVGSGSLSLDILPGDQPGLRDLLVTVEDTGALLGALDVIGTMRNGALVLRATLDNNDAMRGQLTVSEYRLVDAPVLARILSVAALTGILDALSGEGIGFTNLDAPFVYQGGVLTLTDFRTHGPALGLTASGTVNLGQDQFDLAGTMVPAYAVNSLLGKIPLVGGLLTGFEEGGGTFAANFTLRGPLEAPEVSVNPLSALAPGLLRRIFNIFDTPDEPPEAAPEGLPDDGPAKVPDDVPGAPG